METDYCAVCGTHGQVETNVIAIGELTLGDVNMIRQRNGAQLYCSLDCLESDADGVLSE